jgi:hypothetical protein
MNNTIKMVPALLGLAALAMAPSAMAALQAEASLNRSNMTTDDAAVLSLTVSSDQQVSVELPQVDGLQFQPRASTTSMQIINGKVSSSITRSVMVRALEPGDYTIPRLRATAGSEEAFSESPLQLNVSQGSGRNAQGRSRGAVPAPAPNLSPGGQPGSTAQVTAGKPGDLAFLEVVPGKTASVVGELVPIEIRAYFRAGERISLRSSPTVKGAAFIMKNQQGDPRQERVTLGGIPYTRLTFYAGMAAAKPGEFPAEVTLDATVVVREKGSGRNPLKDLRSQMGSMFDDPFFDDGMLDDFFGRYVEKEVDLVADPITMIVTELPAQGKPANFTGAVGRFTARAEATETAVQAGDPITLKVMVEGEGNFDRVSMPRLAESANWKVYPASSEFVSANAIGQAGVKIFEQIIVPQSPEITAIPTLELPFYDPQAGVYQVARTEALPLEVSGDALPQEAAELTASVAPDGSTDNINSPVSSSSRSITPLYARQWFLAAQSLALAVILCGILAMLIRRVRTNPQRLLRRQHARELGRARAEMNQAIRHNDSSAFFATLRRLIQWHVGRTLGLEPAAVTASDVPDSAIREIFTTADAATFSGQSFPADDLRQWKERVLQIIN